MNAKKNGIKGITLTSLIITVIVLLILSGVAIAALSGENGIITKAKEAKEKNNERQAKEELELAIIELERQYEAERKRKNIFRLYM